MDKNYNSVLIGNGLDIQIGGDDYSNKWIIVRLLAKAKMGKYDVLFMNNKDSKPVITGDEIIQLFSHMVETANKAREDEYKDLAGIHGDKDLIDALKDFKKNHTCEIRSIEEIGMEDWLLIFFLFLLEHKDIFDKYKPFKQGFERMVFDAIYCEGNIQKLHFRMTKLSKQYFNNFDNIFTINYDNTIEKLTKRTVFHLHGDFKTKFPSENLHNAQGYLRIQAGQNVWFPPQFEHCNCTAILDFSGNRKYKFATDMTEAYLAFEKLKKMAQKNEVEFKNILEKLSADQRELANIGVQKNLYLGYNYHFQDFEQITGTLKIIGLDPKNDSHIFSCINKSNINNVVFYHYFDTKDDDKIAAEKRTIALPINKSYKIENVKEIWDEIKVCQPSKQSNALTEPQLQALNALALYPLKPITMDDIKKQLNSIPKFTKTVISEMMNSEIKKSEYHNTPKTEKELFARFIEFGKTLEVAALSPQTLYYIYITGSQPNNKMSHSKNKNRKHKK